MTPEVRASGRDWLAVFGAILGAFTAILDIQITNSSLKDIQGALATATLLLKARVDAGGADHPVAAAALERLYVEAIRATEGAR